MNAFLSEEEILKHKEYLRRLKLKYSILEKSIPSIINRDFREINRILRGSEREEVLSLLSKIKLHELFFSSFTDKSMKKSGIVASEYGSEANFLYTLFKEAKNTAFKFLCVALRSGKIFTVVTDDYLRLTSVGRPVLAVDLYEHAYFGDYGFDREKYLENALLYLNLDRINEG